MFFTTFKLSVDFLLSDNLKPRDIRAMLGRGEKTDKVGKAHLDPQHSVPLVLGSYSVPGIVLDIGT